MHKYFDENSTHTLQKKIRERLSPHTENIEIDIRDRITSTNDIAKALAQSGAHEGYTIIALSQTQGRGTSDRSFYSPPESGIYMSTVLRPQIHAADSVLITPLCAVAVARALETISSRECKIKWINDLLIEGKKVCGILTEGAVSSGGHLNFAIAGIGINVATTDFPDELRESAGSLFEKMPDDLTSKKADIIAAVLNNLFAMLPKISSGIHLEEYRRRSVLIGKRVSVLIPNGENDQIVRSGTVSGIDERACLCVKLDGGHTVLLNSSSQLISYSI